MSAAPPQPVRPVPRDTEGLALAEPDDPEPPSGPSITLHDTTRTLTPECLESAAHLSLRAVRATGCDTGEVRVRLIDDDAMSCAHAQHMNDPTVTDVITFDLADGASANGAALDIDLLVCVDEARRQSASYNHPLEHELVLYILHGVLHCLDHEDHTDAAAGAMHAREDEILRAIGIGTTYAPKPASLHPRSDDHT